MASSSSAISSSDCIRSKSSSAMLLGSDGGRYSCEQSVSRSQCSFTPLLRQRGVDLSQPANQCMQFGQTAKFECCSSLQEAIRSRARFHGEKATNSCHLPKNRRFITQVDVCVRWRFNSRKLLQLPQARLELKPACLSEIRQIAAALGEPERLHLSRDRSIAASGVVLLGKQLLTRTGQTLLNILQMPQ